MSSFTQKHTAPPRLILCAGGLGSGKSKLIDMVVKKCSKNTHIIDFESFTHDERVNLDRHFHDEKMGENEAWFLQQRQQRFDEALAEGGDIVLETHLDHVEQLKGFIEAAREKNYGVQLLGITLTPETYLRLRRQKDHFTAATPMGIASQKRFLEQWENLPIACDESRLYERLYNPPRQDGARPVDARRFESICDAWGLPKELRGLEEGTSWVSATRDDRSAIAAKT